MSSPINVSVKLMMFPKYMRLLFSEMKFMQNKRTKIALTYAMIKVVSLNSSMRYLLPSKSSRAKLYLIVIK